MTPERWHKIKEVFHAASDRSSSDRAQFLEEVCAGDEELRLKVVQMLEADAAENLIVDRPAIEGIAPLFASEEEETIAGRTFGHYQVEHELGRGGMGQVYLAKDTRLDRPVALKLLPDAFSKDPERVRRFQQEARVVSALNHPYIMTIHEIGETNGIRFMVAEFVDGETLRAHIDRGDPDLSRLLKIIIQVAEALGAAHGVNIVHRDIKPENIMVRLDGYVKVLDFGLAKAPEEHRPRSGSDQSPFSDIDTSPGLLLGTVKYMSPEQARGYEVDARTDIFSLGVVLYEAVTGNAPFQGKTGADILIAIAGQEPRAINEQIADAPAGLQQIVDKALRKNWNERYQTIEEMRRDLESLRDSLSRSSSGQLSQGGTFAVNEARPPFGLKTVVSKFKEKKLKYVTLALVTVLIATALSFGFFKLMTPQTQATALSPANFQFSKITTQGMSGAGLVSPDGRYIVYQSEIGRPVGMSALILRQTATDSTLEILPARPGFSNWGYAFTPDGDYLYCWIVERANLQNSFFERVPLLPGRTEKIVDHVGSHPAFSPDGKHLAFVRVDPSTNAHDLVVADVNGENPRVLVPHNGRDKMFRSLAWSPDGQVIAVIDISNDAACDQCYQVLGFRSDSGEEVQIAEQRWRNIREVTWLPDRSGLLISAIDRPGSQEGLWLLSHPGGVARRLTNELNAFEGVSITADGKKILTSQSDRPSAIWVAPLSDPDVARKLTPISGQYRGANWTPDGRILYVLGGDLWIMNANGEGRQQLTFERGGVMHPDISPDGRYVVFASTRKGSYNIWRLELRGGELKQLSTGAGENGPVCTPDGQSVIYRSWEHGKLTIWKMPLAGGEATPIAESNVDDTSLSVSPDGKLLAFRYRDAALKHYIAIRPLDGGPNQNAWEISSGTGFQFSPDGKSLIYAEGSNVWLQPLDSARPKQLTAFTGEYMEWCAISPDGQNLVMTRGTRVWDLVLIDVKN